MISDRRGVLVAFGGLWAACGGLGAAPGDLRGPLGDDFQAAVDSCFRCSPRGSRCFLLSFGVCFGTNSLYYLVALLFG